MDRLGPCEIHDASRGQIQRRGRHAYELRATYATIPDALSGRMPLAYAQLVQILVDVLVSASPVALIHSVGGFGAIVG